MLATLLTIEYVDSGTWHARRKFLCPVGIFATNDLVLHVVMPHYVCISLSLFWQVTLAGGEAVAKFSWGHSGFLHTKYIL